MKSIHSLDDQTIIAQCTPTGSGAIALLRLSGIDAKEIADKFCRLPDGKSILEKSSHTIHYGYVVSNKAIKNLRGPLAPPCPAKSCTKPGSVLRSFSEVECIEGSTQQDFSENVIDRVMIIIMNGPRTFTGQDTVEITCHNNQFLIESIINQAIVAGARLAQEGEFSKRAFLSKKLDLLQAEAINELIGANTQLALKKSLSQLDGSFSNWVNQIESGLIRTLAFCEASFEFLDEEHEFGEKIKADLLAIIKKIEKIRSIFDQQQQIRTGIKIALIGSVNAGKSSIFNSLLGQKRAIVTNIAGTTRDSIEAGLTKNGNFWTIVDTAGLRETDNVIEQEGIKRSLEEAQKADIILLVFDGSQELKQETADIYLEILNKYKNKVIIVKNKIDQDTNPDNKILLNGDINNKYIEVSSLNNIGIESLETAIQSKIDKLLGAVDSPFLLNKRQSNLLFGLEGKLKKIVLSLDGQIQYELLSYDLKDAIAYLSELTGKSVSEAGMNAVFKEFCVGK